MGYGCLVAASLLLFYLVYIVDGQAAAQIGGKPPAAVKTKLCSISNVFAQLNKIKHDKECLKGCAKVKGKCPTDWYPGKAVRWLRARPCPARSGAVS